MFGQMQQSNPYQTLLQQIMGQNSGGLTNPGGGMPPASGAPQLPQPGQRAAGGMPGTPPSAFGANGQMNAQPGAQQGGMFGGLAQNPQLMQMLQAMRGQQAGGMQPGGGMPQGQPQGQFMSGQAPMNQGQPLPSQVGAYNIPQQPTGIQALLQRMFAGGGQQ